MAGHKSANLLLVDDDPGLLKLLGMRLTSEGFHIVTAESGQEALKLLLKEKIDLVISDLRMDEMDGMALFAEIQRQQPGICRTQVHDCLGTTVSSREVAGMGRDHGLML